MGCKPCQKRKSQQRQNTSAAATRLEPKISTPYGQMTYSDYRKKVLERYKSAHRKSV